MFTCKTSWGAAGGPRRTSAAQPPEILLLPLWRTFIMPTPAEMRSPWLPCLRAHRGRSRQRLRSLTLSQARSAEGHAPGSAPHVELGVLGVQVCPYP
jgi:hypothetical protein